LRLAAIVVEADAPVGGRHGATVRVDHRAVHEDADQRVSRGAGAAARIGDRGGADRRRVRHDDRLGGRCARRRQPGGSSLPRRDAVGAQARAHVGVGGDQRVHAEPEHCAQRHAHQRTHDAHRLSSHPARPAHARPASPDE
jgi:hypothetical protein